MNITRTVITDLMPLYLSKEASPDTRALIDEFLQNDAEFARLVAESGKYNLPGAIPASLPPDSELASFTRTKRLLKRRSFLMSFALMFTGFAVCFKFTSAGITWFWQNNPAGAFVCAGVALLAWIGLLVTRHRLRTTSF